MTQPTTLAQRWQRFWFEDVPPELFSLLRIALGATGLISLIGLLPLDAFWSPDGLAPLPGGGVGLRSALVDAGLGEASGIAFFVVLLAAFACMTVGLFTSSAVVICFLGSVAQMRWNALPLTSGHTVLVAVLFPLVWADLGRRFSVDEWRHRHRMTAAQTSASRDSERDAQAMWPLRLIRIQIALVYAASGVFKLLGAAWRDGSAIHYTTAHNVYGRVFHALPLPGGLDPLLTLLTYATLLWELAFPVLLLRPWPRRVALLGGVGVHLGIWSTMEVGPFSWVMLASYLAFLNPHMVAARMSGRRPSLGVRDADGAASERSRSPLSAA